MFDHQTLRIDAERLSQLSKQLHCCSRARRFNERDGAQLVFERPSIVIESAEYLSDLEQADIGIAMRFVVHHRTQQATHERVAQHRLALHDRIRQFDERTSHASPSLDFGVHNRRGPRFVNASANERGPELSASCLVGTEHADAILRS